ncbi:MAG TPA: MFS transporter [Solirubrobacteraceae bacterium]|nr:MFS transporter [Solirubrobacteraceae bacterium]
MSTLALAQPRIDRVRRSPALLLAMICAAQFMVILDVAVVNVALPSIRQSLGFSTVGLQWVVNAYTLTFAGFLMLGGRASDLLGRRRVLLTGIALFTLSSLACALSGSQDVLVGARAIQGIGGAIISPASLSILTTSFAEGRERNRALGLWAAIGGIGAASGALVGGLLTQGLGWQWVFLVNVPVGLLVLAIAPQVVPEGRAELGHRHFDLGGALLVTSGFVALVFGIVRADTLGWSAAGVLGPIVAGLALLGAFVLVEGRVAQAPLVPLWIFKLRRVRAANLVVLALYAGVFVMWFFVSLYLQGVLGYDAIQTGLAFLPMTLGVAIASTRAPRIVAKLGTRWTITAGMLTAALGLALLSGIHPGASFASVLPGGTLAAFGLGLALVPSTIVAVQGVAPAVAGAASGLLNTSRLLGGAIGLAVLTTIADGRTDAALAHGARPLQALTDGYGEALLVAAIIVALGAAAAATLLRENRA